MKTFKKFLNEEYDEQDIKKLINTTKDPKKRKMLLFYYKKMIRDEVPDDIIYKEIKNLKEKGIQALAQRTEFDNIEREDNEDLDEDPKEVLDSIKNVEIKRMAKMYYDGMKRDRAPTSAILDMMKDFKNETFWDIPDEIKTPKKQNKVQPPTTKKDLIQKLKADVSIGDYEEEVEKKSKSKEDTSKGKPKEDSISYHVRGNNDKMTKEQEFKEKVNMILRGTKGYKTKTQKEKEEEEKLLYKDFDSIKEEFIKGTNIKTAAAAVKRITDKFPKKNYIAICRQVASVYGLNSNDVISAYKKLIR